MKERLRNSGGTETLGERERQNTWRKNHNEREGEREKGKTREGEKYKERKRHGTDEESVCGVKEREKK